MGSQGDLESPKGISEARAQQHSGYCVRLAHSCPTFDPWHPTWLPKPARSNPKAAGCGPPNPQNPKGLQKALQDLMLVAGEMLLASGLQLCESCPPSPLPQAMKPIPVGSHYAQEGLSESVSQTHPSYLSPTGWWWGGLQGALEQEDPISSLLPAPAPWGWQRAMEGRFPLRTPCSSAPQLLPLRQGGFNTPHAKLSFYPALGLSLSAKPIVCLKGADTAPPMPGLATHQVSRAS